MSNDVLAAWNRRSPPHLTEAMAALGGENGIPAPAQAEELGVGAGGAPAAAGIEEVGVGEAPIQAEELGGAWARVRVWAGIGARIRRGIRVDID